MDRLSEYVTFLSAIFFGYFIEHFPHYLGVSFSSNFMESMGSAVSRS